MRRTSSGAERRLRDLGRRARDPVALAEMIQMRFIWAGSVMRPTKRISPPAARAHERVLFVNPSDQVRRPAQANSGTQSPDSRRSASEEEELDFELPPAPRAGNLGNPETEL